MKIFGLDGVFRKFKWEDKEVESLPSKMMLNICSA